MWNQPWQFTLLDQFLNLMNSPYFSLHHTHLSFSSYFFLIETQLEILNVYDNISFSFPSWPLPLQCSPPLSRLWQIPSLFPQLFFRFGIENMSFKIFVGVCVDHSWTDVFVQPDVEVCKKPGGLKIWKFFEEFIMQSPIPLNVDALQLWVYGKVCGVIHERRASKRVSFLNSGIDNIAFEVSVGAGVEHSLCRKKANGFDNSLEVWVSSIRN